MVDKSKAIEIYLDMIERERNIYEPATLYDHVRVPVEKYTSLLRSPDDRKSPLSLNGERLITDDGSDQFSIQDDVIDFRSPNQDKGIWDELNEQFLNYHKSLAPYTLINSAPIINYLSLKSGVGNWKNIRVLDVGGGTGHTYCSLFRHPETIEYFLLDPNLRLVHDQFIRVYPELTYLPMAHILGYAENLPFQEDCFDLVISLSSIDHFKDYESFIKDAYRVLKPGGHLLISSHLDIPAEEERTVTRKEKLFGGTFVERLSRFLYYRKYQVGSDDHTYHFVNQEPFESSMRKENFEILQSEIYSRYFFVLGKKQ